MNSQDILSQIPALLVSVMPSDLGVRRHHDRPPVPQAAVAAQGQLLALLERSRALRLTRFEGSGGWGDLVPRLLPATGRILDEALALLDRLYEGIDPGDRSAVPMADTCYRGRAELDHYRACLEELEPHRPLGSGRPVDRDLLWSRLVRADQALVALIRVLSSIEIELAGLFGFRTRAHRCIDLGEILRVRRAYGRLRARARRVQKDSEDLTVILPEVLEALYQLRLDRAEAPLRFTSRWRLGELVAACEAWLAATAPDESVGRMLLGELEQLLDLLKQLNERRSLVFHDRRLTLELLATFEMEPLHRPVDGKLRARLDDLLGRDPGLDELLLGTPEAHQVLSALHRLRRGLRARS